MRNRQQQVQFVAIAATAAAMLVSFVGAPFLQDQPLHHVPTCLILLCLGWLASRRRISTPSLLSILALLLLHIVGARWIYSKVPYDDWARAVFGSSITDRFGFQRNHYDRLVHFAYGAFATVPQLEFLERRLRITGLAALVVSFAAVMGAGAVYEIAEWLLAVTAAPDWADRYNGQQGDAWDAHKDMALAGLGAVAVSPIAFLCCSRIQRKSLSG